MVEGLNAARRRAFARILIGIFVSIALIPLLSLIQGTNAGAVSVGTALCVQEVGSSPGVSVTTSGNDCVVQFTAVGPNTWTPPAKVTSVRALIVAGGGGGGSGAWAGGGGAGGVVHATTLVVTPGQSRAVNVGAGGIGGNGTIANANTTCAANHPGRGVSGNNSSFESSTATLTAVGGGGGGGYGWASRLDCANGKSGGSGGGSSEASYVPTRALTTQSDTTASSGAVTVYGNNGGYSTITNGVQAGAGGGGAGAQGGDATAYRRPGVGGAGVQFDITGSSLWYAGGGGGASCGTCYDNYWQIPNPALGGSGVGGAGGTDQQAASGGANLLGGGGGGAQWNSGGTGGSGIVVLRYTIPGPDQPDLDAASDLGVSSTDNLTSDATPTITVSGLSAGATGTVTAVKSGSSNVTCALSSGSCTLGTLSDGIWSITATQTHTGVTSASSTALSITVETILPTVTAFSSSTANGTFGIGGAISISATTSEAVQSGNTITVTLNSGATVQLMAASAGTTLTGTYTVASGQSSSDLTVSSFTIGTMRDTAGNAMTSTTLPAAASNIAQNSALVIDGVVPTVSNVTSSSTNGTFSVGGTVSIQVVFSEAVSVVGAPQLTLETGSTDRAVGYVSGSGTTSLTFTYTVQAGDSSTDLDYVGTLSLALNGGSIVDAATNAATLTLPAPGATGSLGANKAIVVTSEPTKIVSARTPVGMASGAAFTTQPQVSLQDLGNNVVTNDSSTVVTASVSAGATLVGTTTATVSSGVATFNNLGISGTAGTAYTITYSATYGGNALTVATQSVTPTVGAATQISITTQPVGNTAGALLGTQPVVKVLDSGNNVVTTASVSVTASASGGTLAGTTTVSTTSGVATFTDLTFAGTANTNYTLTFAATGYTSQTSSSFSVGVGAATKLVLTTSANGATYNSAFTTQPVVEVRDAGNNKVATATNTVTATLSSGTVVGTGNTTLTAVASSGVASFSSLGVSGAPSSLAVTVTYSSGSLTTTSDSITLSKADQTVTFADPADRAWSSTAFAVAPTSSAGLTVAISSSTTSICTTSGLNITMVSVGTCTIVASQTGNDYYNAASSVTQSFVISQASQTITATNFAGRSWTPTTSGISSSDATASSGLTVSWSSTTTGVCTVTGTTLALVSSGTCSLTASQPGNTLYSAATDVVRSFLISRVTVTRGAFSIDQKTYGDAAFDLVNPTAKFGVTDVAGTWSYSSATNSVATVSGNRVTIVGQGTSTITATFTPTDTGKYNTGSNNHTLVVVRAAPELGALSVPSPNKSFGDAAFSLTAPTATFGGSAVAGSWSYSSGTTSVATISGSTVTIAGAGSSTLTATFTPTDSTNYSSGSVTATLTIEKATPSFSWSNVSATFGDVNATITAPTVVGSVAGSWTYSSATTSVAAISGGTAFDFGSVGTSLITATFTPTNTTNYVSGGTVGMTVEVVKANQSALTVTSTSGTYGTALNLSVGGGTTNGSVSYSVTGAGCSITSGALSKAAAGDCSVTATMAGDSSYNAVSSLATTVAFGRTSQSALTVTSTSGTYGSSLNLAVGGGTTNGSVTYVVTGTGCSESGGALTKSATGDCSVTATMAGNSNYNAVSSSATTVSFVKANQSSLTLTSTSGTYGVALTLTTSGGTTAGSLSYSVTGTGCSIASGALSKSAAGDCSVTATMAGNGNYEPVSSSATTVTFVKANQSALTVTSVSGTYGSALTLATSGGTTVGSLSYSVTGAGCSLASGVLSKSSAGDCSVTATMAGNGNYEPVSSAATTVSFGLASQSALTVTSTSGTYGSSLSLITSGGTTNGTVTYVVTGTGCSASGGALTKTTAGDCAVTATMAGNSDYNAVSSSATTVTFNKASQSALTLTSTLGTYGTSITLTYNGGSGTGNISYSVSGTDCSITSGVLSKDAAGDCSVTVTKATDTNYEAASSSATTVTFAQASNSITFSSLSDRLWSASTFTVSPTATSGDTPTISSTTTNVCTVSSLTITMVSSGTCSLTASEDGNGNYLAATNVVRTFEIARVTPSAATWTDVTVTYSAANQSVSPPAVSFGGSTVSGAWTYASSDTAVVSLASSTMTFGNFGSAIVTGSFTPTDTGKYNSTSATMNVSVEKIRPLFTWVNVSKTYGDAPFSLTTPTVTNSVAGTWTYSSANASVATMSSATATVVGAGTSTITATFTPTDTTNYVSGGTVAMTVTVSQVTPMFSWSNVSATYGDANASITAPTVTNSISGAWSYASATTSVAAISGADFDYGNAGTSVITATFTPTDTTNYVSGGTVTMTVAVAQATPTFTWSNVAKTYGDSTFSLFAPTVAGSVAGSWSYASSTTSVVSLSGSTATVNAAGTSVVTATFTPTDASNYVSGGTVTMTISVATADQAALTVTSLLGTYGSSVSLAVSGGTTGGSVTYVTTGDGCSVTSGALSKLSAGDCSVTATMAGNSNYNAVSSLATTVTFAKASQSALSVTTTSGTYGINLTLNVSGGTTAGSVTYVVTGVGCSQSSGVLTKNAAGDCSVTATMAGNNNYNAVSSSATTVTFARVALTVTAEAKSKQFGATDPALTHVITTGSLVIGDSLTGSLARTSGEDVGTYAIGQGTLANSNYTITYVGADLTITQRPITVTATATTKQYGAADPTFDYSVTTGSLVSGGALSGALSGALGRESGANVGSYAMTIGTLANSNYNITFVPANLTITQRPITVTAAAKSKEYGASDPAFTHTVTTGSLVGGDTLTGSLGRVTGENIGTYAILRGTLDNTNYDITYAGALLTVTQRPITVTADALTKEYGATDPQLTFAITTGSLAGSDTLTGALSRAIGEAVGTYAINQGTLTNNNYNISYTGANLTVTRRAITVTATALSKEYGAVDPALTHVITTGSLVIGDTLSGSLTRVGGEDVGTYAIGQGTMANSNYTITYVGADLTITQRPITVTAAAATKEYGATDPSFTPSVTAGSLFGSDTLTGSLSRVTGENVGGYALTIGTLANTNYNITFVPANLTITQRPVTVTAADKTKVFGSTDPSLTYSVTSGSLVGSDSFSGGLSRASGEDVGTYSITRGTLANTNYNISFVNGTMSVTRATQGALTVTTSQVTYGTSVVLGSTGGSGTGDVTYAVTSAGTAGCSISSDTLTATGGVGSTCTVTATKTQSTNYNAASSSATTITVIDRAITVTATAVSKTYGDNDPTFAYVVTSGALVSGDTLAGTLGRTSGENVGTYTINQGTLANSNYAITFVPAGFTIDARPLTLTATNRTKTFGDSDPSLAYTIASGTLVGSDALSGSISRNSGENIGSYVISQGTLAHSNYAITFNDGSFVINGANQSGFTLSAADTLVTYQESTTLSVTGGNGNGAVSFEVTDGTGGCTISGNTVTAVAAGTCVITATKAQEGNYNEATSNIVTITVARRAQIVTFTKPADRNFSTTAFTLAPSVDSGLTPVLTSQTANVCTVSGLNVTMRDSGNCTLVASSNSTNNYAAATDVTQTFEITAVVPYAPILDSLSASDGAISASFALGSSGGSPLLNHEYSLDNGVTWTAWPTGSITSPLNIGGLANGVEYQVMVRAINIVGQGAASNMLAVTPVAPVIVPSAPAPTASVDSTSTTVVSSTTTVFVVTTVTRNPGSALPTTTVARRAVTTTISQRNGQLTTTTTIRLTTTTTGVSTTTTERIPATAQRVTPTTTQNTIQTQTSVFESISPLAPVTRVPDTIPPSLAPTKSAAVVDGFAVSMDVRRVNNEQVVATLGESTMTLMSLSDNGAPEPLLTNGSIAVTAGGTVRVSGTGMLPAEPIEVWMYSTPVKLGEVIAGADGTFSAELLLPSDAELGSHKLQFVGKKVDGAEMVFAQGILVVDDTVLTMNRAGVLDSATADNLGKDNVVSISTMSKDDAANIMLWFLVIMILVAGLLAAQPRRKSIAFSPVQRIEIATPWLAGMRLPRMLMLLVGVLAGFGAANSASFSATAPSTLWVAVLIIVGLLDVMAGGVAGLVFAISVIAGGSVGSMLDIRVTALVVLIATLPNVIGRAARPHGARFAVQSVITAVLNVTVVVSLASLFAPVGGVNYELSAWLVKLSWVAALATAGRFALLRITQSSNDHYDAHMPALRVVGVVSAAAFVVGTNVATIWTLAAIAVLAIVVIFGLRIRVGLSVQHVRKVFVGSVAMSLALVIAATGTLIPQSSRDEVTNASQITPIGELNVIGQLGVLIDGYPRTFVAINTGVGEITFINGSIGQSLTIESWSTDNERIPLAGDNTLHLVRDEYIVIRANGYAANETMDAWLFTNPGFVGNALTNGDGKLETRFFVPVGKNDGLHTLQIRLVGEDGKVVIYSIPAVLSSVAPNTEA